MSDPWFMLLVLRRLGPGYVVWDKAGEIDFRSPGRGAVRAEFTVTDEQIEEIRQAAAGGEKVLRWFETELTGSEGAVVAVYRKQIYVRKKPPRA